MRLKCRGEYVDIGGALARKHSGFIRSFEEANEDQEIFEVANEDQEIEIACSIAIELEVLQCIKRYCESHGPPFPIQLSDAQLIQLLAAADYLDVEGLLDLACKQLGTVLDACTVEEIRTRFQIPVDMHAKEALDALDADDEWLMESPNTEPAGRLSDAAREMYAANDEATCQLIEGLPDVDEARGISGNTEAALERVTENTEAALKRVRDGADQAGDGTCALRTVPAPMAVLMLKAR
jgi:hypothetical protein